MCPILQQMQTIFKQTLEEWFKDNFKHGEHNNLAEIELALILFYASLAGWKCARFFHTSFLEVATKLTKSYAKSIIKNLAQ